MEILRYVEHDAVYIDFHENGYRNDPKPNSYILFMEDTIRIIPLRRKPLSRNLVTVRRIM